MYSIYLKKSNPPLVVGKTKPFFQPKLTKNQPNDPYNYRDEHETDAVADKVSLRSDNECIQQPFFSPAVQSKLPENGTLIQKQDDEQEPSESIEPMDEVETTGSAPEEAPNVTIELPLPMTIRVNGVMFTSPTFLLEGPNGRIVDLAPFTGRGLLDFPLAALESLGIPVLSYYQFHYGRARQFRGRHFESAYALSGGTSFIRNALHYGYITADDVTLFGAPSSFNLEHYGGIPNLNIVANPMDIGTMINVSYFNYPMFEGHNNPAVLFSITAPFDQNPFEAFTNLGGAIYHALSGDLYNLPDVTHSYPRFQNEPTEAIGSPYTRTRVSRKSEPGSAPNLATDQPEQQTLTEKGSGDRPPGQKEKDRTHSNLSFLQPVFKKGQYSHVSASGKKLLGHELTHVVQQGQAKSISIQKQDDAVLSESESMRDRFRAERRRDLRRIIDCNAFRKIRRDCPTSTGVRLADVLARMRIRVAGNRLCIQFFQERFRINPDIMFDPSGRPSITFVPLLGVSGRTRCPEPTCDNPIPSVSIGTANASDNICNSPLLERTIMHELIHYAHCYRRWGDVGNEATSEEGATICMGTVQEALDAARRSRATVQPTNQK
ncbi:MAG: DUF4157 domain-containing protein [Cyclobacteriaceae bacterium]